MHTARGEASIPTGSRKVHSYAFSLHIFLTTCKYTFGAQRKHKILGLYVCLGSSSKFSQCYCSHSTDSDSGKGFGTPQVLL